MIMISKMVKLQLEKKERQCRLQKINRYIVLVSHVHHVEFMSKLNPSDTKLARLKLLCQKRRAFPASKDSYASHVKERCLKFQTN